MSWYPEVLSEDQTLDGILNGWPIARFGDGELKILAGGDAKTQRGHPKLQAMLQAMLYEPGRCLVGIPNLRSETPKANFWRAFGTPHYTWAYRHAAAQGTTFASSFITRPDSAPWIDRPDYWARCRSIWTGKEVVLVRGNPKSFVPERLEGAKSVDEVICDHLIGHSGQIETQNAFEYHFDALMERLKGEKRPVLLSLGATATALAYKLGNEGVWALDLGHLGMFMKKIGPGGRIGASTKVEMGL